VGGEVFPEQGKKALLLKDREDGLFRRKRTEETRRGEGKTSFKKERTKTPKP